MSTALAVKLEKQMTQSRRTESVQLGCGTLILIAIIVLFFSRGGNDELSNEVRQVGSEVQQLRTTVGTLGAKVDAQTKEIKSLRESLKKNAKNKR